MALHRWNWLLAYDQGADLGWCYGPWFRRQGRPAVEKLPGEEGPIVMRSPGPNRHEPRARRAG